MFKFGLENLLHNASELQTLRSKRVALLAHPASVDQELRHAVDLLKKELGSSLVAAFGPQHGMRGEKQDNMIESDDYLDPVYGIPVFSLYGQVRRPTVKMMDSFDVLLVDLQDVGCRIYTFLTTLFYMLDAAENASGKEIWVLDRPNPAGRATEGHTLDMSFQSFVGAAPLPMRHGLTLGEAGEWYKHLKGYKVKYKVIRMLDYQMSAPVYGWPSELSWVNPSPNMPRLSCARQYAGTVLIEGTNLSEGRGTTIPLEILGAPGLNTEKILHWMRSEAPDWIKGCQLRPCFFEPTFHKFKQQLCSAIQIHADGEGFNYDQFKPYRLVSLMFKAIRQIHPELHIWRSPPYEYEEKLLPLDILAGGEHLRRWADQSSANIKAYEDQLQHDEQSWLKERQPFLLY